MLAGVGCAWVLARSVYELEANSLLSGDDSTEMPGVEEEGESSCICLLSQSSPPRHGGDGRI